MHHRQEQMLVTVSEQEQDIFDGMDDWSGVSGRVLVQHHGCIRPCDSCRCDHCKCDHCKCDRCKCDRCKCDRCKCDRCKCDRCKCDRCKCDRCKCNHRKCNHRKCDHCKCDQVEPIWHKVIPCNDCLRPKRFVSKPCSPCQRHFFWP